MLKNSYSGNNYYIWETNTEDKQKQFLFCRF